MNNIISFSEKRKLESVEHKLLSVLLEIEENIVGVRESLENLDSKYNFENFYIDNIKDSVDKLHKDYVKLMSITSKVEHEIEQECNQSKNILKERFYE